jgi:(p)ppGpp synthase/HD superfamily hydrolase
MSVIEAIKFASTKHKGQTRRGSGLPYVTHPIIVMELVREYKGTSKNLEALLVAALLHDTLEDTDTSYAELERKFGPMAASIVMELTSDPVAIKKMGKNNYLIQKMLKMSRYAFVIKLLDRFSNIMDRPSESYVKKTLKMMDVLKTGREDITERQLKIIEKIEEECHLFLEKESV